MTSIQRHPATGPQQPQGARARRWVRGALALLGCIALLAVAVGVLWWQDWRYSLPTPRPTGLVQAAVGSRIAALPLASLPQRHAGRPVLLHFFNPHCPCSRFNAEHVRELQDRWSDRVDFVAVVQGSGHADAVRALGRLGLHMPAIADPDGHIADACGVYSSPQAVVLASDGRLYFRGNYNASRYCTDAATEFARLALDSLEAGAPPPRFAAAGIAYGCELPSWKRRHV